MLATSGSQPDLVRLVQTHVDSTITKSLIAKTHADSSNGTQEPISRTTVQSATGHRYSASYQIKLRCIIGESCASFDEMFYVVSDLGGADAIMCVIRRTCISRQMIRLGNKSLQRD